MQPEFLLYQWGCFCSITWTLSCRHPVSELEQLADLGWKLVLPPCLPRYGKTSSWQARSSCSGCRLAVHAAVMWGLGAKTTVLPHLTYQCRGKWEVWGVPVSLWEVHFASSVRWYTRPPSGYMENVVSQVSVILQSFYLPGSSTRSLLTVLFNHKHTFFCFRP